MIWRKREVQVPLCNASTYAPMQYISCSNSTPSPLLLFVNCKELMIDWLFSWSNDYDMYFEDLFYDIVEVEVQLIFFIV